MNSKGFLPMLMIGGSWWLALGLLMLTMSAIIFLPILAISLSGELMLLFQIGASVIILSWVRNTVGQGTISLAISGILIYIFVFILPQLSLGIYVLYMLFAFGLVGTIVWTFTIFAGVKGG